MGLESHSQAFREVILRLRRFAPVDTAFVLLEGETGTGKNYLARFLHTHSRRSTGTFREANLAAVDDALAGSELFGHVRGAFTDARTPRSGHFVLAHGGTLFLDELGKASLHVQRRLLRVVETGDCWPIGAERPVQVDARLIGATNVPLKQLVEQGEFLADLHARLGCFRVRIPPLRERRDDIPDLITESLARQAGVTGYASPPGVSGDLMDALVAYNWPQNVRELQSVVLRLLVDAGGAPILQLDLCSGDLAYLQSTPRDSDVLSRELIERTIRNAGTVVAAASRLGVHRSTVYRALRSPD